MGCEPDISDAIERYVSAFERARERGSSLPLESFMPPRSDVAYAEIALELLRVDLELSWSVGMPTRLEKYRSRFAEILEEPARLEQLAFEEYRQRHGAGQGCSSAEYATRYGIDVANWPELSDRVHESPECFVDGEAAWPPAHFEDFEPIEELGRGAFARVFLTRQRSLANRLVALKVTRGYTVEPDRLAQLQHANIVPIYSVHQSAGLQALCMPFLGRQTLAHVLRHLQNSGRLPGSGKDLLSTIVAQNDSTHHNSPTIVARGPKPTRECKVTASIREHFEQANYVDAVVWIVARLAAGLSHAHERGILHRDLKPANVLFSDHGEPMILDFNLSVRSAGSSTRDAVVGGTLPYMSPEQLQSFRTGASIDCRSDIFSLGVMLFELLTGHLPFQANVDAGAGDIAVSIAARNQSAPSVRSLNPGVPPSIANVVARCLAPAADARFQSAAQLQEDLERHLEHRPLVHAADRSPRERLRKWSRRRPRVAAVLAIGVAASTMMAAMAAGWTTREQHFRYVEATNRYESFISKVDETRLPLTLPGADVDVQAEAIAQARSLLSSYGIFDSDEWRQAIAYSRLKPAQRRRLDREIIGLLHLLASAELKRFSAEHDTARRRTFLNEAQAYNSIALDVAAEGARDLEPAVQSQRDLIERIQHGGAAPSQEELAMLQGLSKPQAIAISLLQQGNYAAALPQLRQWRDERLMDLSAWTLLGVAYAGMGNPTEAEECFTTCVRLRPTYPFSYFQRGLSRHQQKKYAAAAVDFSQYLKFHDASPAALINRALAYEALGKIQLARKDIDTAIAAGAQQTRVYFIRSRIRQKLNDASGAQHDFQRGLALTPIDVTSWLARGMAQLKSSPEAALADFRQARDIDPTNRVAAQNILHVLSDRLHREDEAFEILQQLIDLNPQDAQALLTRAVLHARRKDAKLAIADVTAALKVDSTPIVVLHAACAVAQISDQSEENNEMAFQLVAQALGAQPSLASIAETDPDLAPIRGSDRFAEILSAARVIGRRAAAGEATAAR